MRLRLACARRGTECSRVFLREHPPFGGSGLTPADGGRQETLRFGPPRPNGDAHSMPEHAASPTGLPKDSWGETFKRTLSEFKEDKLNHWAAALTYYAVLSLFPALIVLVSLAGIVASPQTVTKFLTDTISSIGPESAVETFKGPIESVTSSSGTAGIMAIVGVITALWSASGYVGAFTEASNSIYEVEEGRPVWKKKPLQLLVTFVCILLVAITALSLVLTGPLAKAVGDAIGLGDTAVTVWQWAKWPVLLGLVLVILHVLYFASPNAKVGVKWISGGTVITLVVWLVASALFALYVSMFGSYNKTYGSLAGVIVFLLWLWITNMAVLLGVEFKAPAGRFVEARDDAAIVAAVRAADDAGEPLLIVAGGSNLVVADAGFPGTVLRIATRGVAGGIVAAGEPWDPFVARCVAGGLAGVECLSGIPGSVGATPIQNVGAYGQEVADVIVSVRAYDRGEGAVREVPAAGCGFAYRSSVFKRNPGRWVVLSVSFDLPLRPESTPIRYGELARALGIPEGGTAPLADVREAVPAPPPPKGMGIDPADPQPGSAGR